MKERPILMSTPMVNAIMEGHKTMTRRVMKPQPDNNEYVDIGNRHIVPIEKMRRYCPYGQMGDRLWVRETWIQRENHKDEGVDYKANYINNGVAMGKMYGGWKPSIFMPRWASRITLEITNVRVERLQGITKDDIWEEGILPSIIGDTFEEEVIGEMEGRLRFQTLWDSINGKTYPWSSNPWVWVIEFVSIKEGKI